MDWTDRTENALKTVDFATQALFDAAASDISWEELAAVQEAAAAVIAIAESIPGTDL